MNDMDEDVQVGEVKNIITHDYLLDLYEDIQSNDELTEKEKEERVAVLQVLKDHIGEYMVIKYKETEEIND